MLPGSRYCPKQSDSPREWNPEEEEDNGDGVGMLYAQPQPWPKLRVNWVWSFTSADGFESQSQLSLVELGLGEVEAVVDSFLIPALKYGVASKWGLTWAPGLVWRWVRWRGGWFPAGLDPPVLWKTGRMRRALRVSVRISKSELIISQEEGRSWTWPARLAWRRLLCEGCCVLSQAPEGNFRSRMVQLVTSRGGGWGWGWGVPPWGQPAPSHSRLLASKPPDETTQRPKGSHGVTWFV